MSTGSEEIQGEGRWVARADTQVARVLNSWVEIGILFLLGAGKMGGGKCMVQWGNWWMLGEAGKPYNNYYLYSRKLGYPYLRFIRLISK